MTDQDFLKQALLIAEYSPEPVGCGAVIVQNGEIIAKAFNSQRADRRVMHHAEIKVLELANDVLHSRIFENATIYSSCEPCVMCLAALSFAKVERIVFAHSMLELFPTDPVAKIDAAALIKQFNFVPQLEQLALA